MDMRVFLAYVVKLEAEAGAAYLELVEVMAAQGNADAVAFFREMAGFCHLHWQTAMKRAGFDDTTDIPEIIASAPASGTEVPDLNDAGSPFDLDGATALALAAERRGVAFYSAVARTTINPQTGRLADEFAEEERRHVLALERFLGRRPY